MNYSAVIAPSHHFRADLDRGGSVRSSGILLYSSVARAVSERVDLGFSLGYSFEDYRFREPLFSGGLEPWSEIHTVSGALSYSRELDNRWQVFFSPSLRFSGESGAKTGDALTWGGLLSFARMINPDLVLGLGISFLDDIDRLSVFPVLIVQWNITDRLALSNSPRSGPAGPAGLELSWRLDEGWTLGMGAAWRSKRFRLDKQGFSPGGVGITRGVPVWLRGSRSLPGGINIHVYGGALFAGELRVDDRYGNRVAAEDYSSAVFVSTALSMRF